MRSSTSSDHGQATVELALSLPLLCTMLLGSVQVAVVVRDRLAVQLAAREGARAAVVAPLDGAASAAEQAARDAVALSPLQVRVRASDAVTTVDVAYTDPTDVPLVGLLLPAVRVHASVTMQREPP